MGEDAVILFLACAAPEAPAELDELTVYLYENHADDEAMAVGVQSLAIWLEANPDLGGQIKINMILIARV